MEERVRFIEAVHRDEDDISARRPSFATLCGCWIPLVC